MTDHHTTTDSEAVAAYHRVSNGEVLPEPLRFWREGATYVHRASGTKHSITRIFRSGPEWVADYVSDHGPGQGRLSVLRPSDYVRSPDRPEYPATSDEAAVNIQQSAADWHTIVVLAMDRGDSDAAAFAQQHRARVYRNARAAMGHR